MMVNRGVLEPYKPHKDRKFVPAPKFYFFDVGVAHFINRKTVQHLSDVELGKSFEHLIYCEIRAVCPLQSRLEEPSKLWKFLLWKRPKSSF